MALYWTKRRTVKHPVASGQQPCSCQYRALRKSSDIYNLLSLVYATMTHFWAFGLRTLLFHFANYLYIKSLLQMEVGVKSVTLG